MPCERCADVRTVIGDVEVFKDEQNDLAELKNLRLGHDCTFGICVIVQEMESTKGMLSTCLRPDTAVDSEWAKVRRSGI